VYSLEVIFASRSDNVPSLVVDYQQLVGLLPGDKVLTSTVIEGGSDTSSAEIQSWEITQNSVISKVQVVNISVPIPALELQTISLSSGSAVDDGYLH